MELDYMHSADGVPMVFHDDTLDRTTNARQVLGRKRIGIATRSASELGLLDAGSWFSAEFAGTKIPTLAEAIDLIQTKSMTLIERKTGDAATCIRLLSEKNLLESVIVQSLDWQFLQDCRSLSQQVNLIALGSRLLTPKKLEQIRPMRPLGIGWDNRYITAKSVAAIRERGWRAWVWTVDQPRRAEELIHFGVTGLISNVPQVMLDVVNRVGMAR